MGRKRMKHLTENKNYTNSESVAENDRHDITNLV